MMISCTSTATGCAQRRWTSPIPWPPTRPSSWPSTNPARLLPSLACVALQDAMELVAGADVELGEDLVQVVFDGARAHEQLGSDLGVGQAVAGQPADLGLPGGELGGGLGGALADTLAGGPQLARGPVGEPAGSHGGEHLMRGAQLLAGVDAPVLPAQPLAVQEMGAGELHAQP